MHKPARHSLLADTPYLLGVAGYSLVDTLFATWLIFFFAPPPERGVGLVSPQLFGLALFSAKVVEAAANPLVGFAADRSGRPWFFLLAGTLAAGGAGVALFLLPVPGEGLRNALLLFALLPLSLAGEACYIVPYLGLLPRLGRTDLRRLQLTNSQALLIPIGVLFGQVLSGVALDRLGNNLVLTVSLFAAFGVALMLLPLLSVRGLNTRAEGFTWLEALAILRRNRGFRVHTIAQFCFWLGFNQVRYGAVYIVTVLLGEPEKRLSFYFAGIFAALVPSLIAVRFLVPRLGKRRTMILAMGIFTLTLPLLLTVGRPMGFLTESQWAMGLFVLLGFPLAVLSAVQNPIVAEQVERDAERTGVAKGALFFGVQGFVIKLSAGLAGAMLGLLVGTFGYSRAEPLGVQLLGPVAGLFALGAAIAYSLYPPADELPGRSEDVAGSKPA